MSKPKIERVEIGIKELEAIIERTRAVLSEEEHRQIKAALSTLARLTQELEKKRTSISRLRHLLFGSRSEKNAAVLNRQGVRGFVRGRRQAEPEKQTRKNARATGATGRAPTGARIGSRSPMNR